PGPGDRPRAGRADERPPAGRVGPRSHDVHARAAHVSARQFALELALTLRERVLPALGSHAARAHAGGGGDRDVTFAIDADAEAHLEAFVAARAPELAVYSEARGLTAPPGAEHVLVIDP